MIYGVCTGSSSVLQFITVLLIFIFVLAITLFTTRWIASYQKGQGKGKNIEVIESSQVGQNKYVQIIRVGEKYMVIGLGKDNITMLTELDVNQIVLPEEGNPEVMGFKETFEKAKNLMKNHHEN